MHFILHQLGFSDSYVLRYLDTRFLSYLARIFTGTNHTFVNFSLNKNHITFAMIFSKITLCFYGQTLLRAVVLNLFYIFYPFFKQDDQIYTQYTQWCSFIKNMKLTNFYRFKLFI